MTTHYVPDEAKIVQAEIMYDKIALAGSSLYMAFCEGTAYSGADTNPDSLAVTKAAKVTDLKNIKFFKKINASGVDSSIQFVKPDTSGVITGYSSRWTVVPKANIYNENAYHFYIKMKIPTGDISYAGNIRTLAVIYDLKKTDSTLATGDKYLASSIDVTSGRLLYLENITKYTRTSSGGELLEVIMSVA